MNDYTFDRIFEERKVRERHTIEIANCVGSVIGYLLFKTPLIPLLMYLAK